MKHDNRRCVVVFDRYGFCGVPDGSDITFIMEAETLKAIDGFAANATSSSRGQILLATIVDKCINLELPVFIQTRRIGIDQVGDDPEHPITFVPRDPDGSPTGFTLSAIQELNGLTTQGELVTCIVTLPSPRRAI